MDETGDLDDFLGMMLRHANATEFSCDDPDPLTQSSSFSKSPSNGDRFQLVWRTPKALAGTVALSDISSQFQCLLTTDNSSSKPTLNCRRGRYTVRTSHRCPGYRRFEIILTADVLHSVIALHSSPVPHEICPICNEVVKGGESFKCICGQDGE